MLPMQTLKGNSPTRGIRLLLLLLLVGVPAAVPVPAAVLGVLPLVLDPLLLLLLALPAMPVEPAGFCAAGGSKPWHR
jgi:hypothetical protein